MKNKTILAISIFVSIFFLIFLFDLTEDIRALEENLIQSEDVIDVSGKIDTRIQITSKDLLDWTNLQSPSGDWKKIILPVSLVGDKNFQDGNYVYYRILIPKKVSDELKFLQNEIEFSPQYLLFSKSEIFVNGELYKVITPHNSDESIVNIPIKNNQDNIVAIKGHIKAGDIGIAHRGKLLLGKGTVLNELHRKAYKRTTVYNLVFILCKASVLFVFTLIYLFVIVDKFFEMSLLFGVFALLDDLLTGEYLNGIFNYNQKVYLYCFINLCEVIFLGLFLSYVTEWSLSKKLVRLLSFFLFVFSALMSIDVLNFEIYFVIDDILRFWNLSLIFVILFFLPRMFTKDKIFFSILIIPLCLTIWSSVFSSNVGHNLKALGNLLIFFMVAYQTFVTFKEEQEKSRLSEIKLLEQEKDVAIGKVASFLAHDVRRPLELIKIMIQNLSNGNNSHEFLQVAKQDIDFAISSVNYQVNEILNYNKNDETILREISFYKVLEGSLRQMMGLASSTRIEFEYDLKANEKVLGEESRLTTVLTNIFSNSLEAIRDMGLKDYGKIRIRTLIRDFNFEILIFNDGPSIPSEILENIFSSNFTFGKVGGTGPGLASVLKALKDMQGSIQAYNLHDGGVEFKIKLKSSGVIDDFKNIQFPKAGTDFSYQRKDDIYTSPALNNEQVLNVFVLEFDRKICTDLDEKIHNFPFRVTIKHSSSCEMAIQEINKRRFDLYIFVTEVMSEIEEVLARLGHLSNEVIIYSNAFQREFQNNFLYSNLPVNFDFLFKNAAYILENKKRILLVDDDKFIRLAWSNFHQDNIICLDSPEKALSFFEQELANIDYCVLDYSFKNSSINGQELLKLLQQIKPGMKFFMSSSLNLNIQGTIRINKGEYDLRKFKV